MNKLVLSISLFLCLSAASANAQFGEERAKGTTTKAGQQILPQAGDFAIGIDATPLLKYGGNLFNNSDNNDPKGIFEGVDQTIYGKYFIQDNQAVRVKLGFNTYNENYKADIEKSADPEEFHKDGDEMKVSRNKFSLDLGYEWRRGYGRLQGFYGAGVGFGFGNAGNAYNRTYKYANSITSSYNNPPTTDFSGEGYGENIIGNSRVTKINTGSNFNLNVNAFVGIEYFFAPKISLGGELGLGYFLNSNSRGKITEEYWDNNAAQTETTEGRIGYASSNDFSTKVKGNVFVMFHF